MKLVLLLAFIITSCGGDREIRVDSGGIPQEPVRNLPPPVERRIPNLVDVDLFESEALTDVGDLSDQVRLNTRYLVGCNYFNQGERNLDGFFDATSLGVNSLSNDRTLTAPVPTGSTDCAYRIDIRDYGWTRSDWEKIEKDSIVQFDIRTTRGQQLQFLTQSRRPYLFINDFLVTAMQADQLTVNNGLYYQLTRQELDFGNFLQQIGSNLVQSANDEETACSGFADSEIALQKTRAVCTYESDNGFLVSSYDSDIAQNKSHFQDPFTAEVALAQGVRRSDKIFQEDAMEHIFPCDNDLLCFRLNGALANGGRAENFAPQTVVAHTRAARLGLDSTIFIGSCVSCHNVGRRPMLQFTDGLANHIRRQAGFNADEKLLGRVFFNQSVQEGRLRIVNQQAEEAVRRLGVDTSDGDPIHENVIFPFRGLQGPEQVCGLLLLPLDLCLERLAGSEQSAVAFGDLLSGGSVSLNTLSANFKVLTQELGAFQDDSLEN
jgi:hypothetical protein